MNTVLQVGTSISQFRDTTNLNLSNRGCMFSKPKLPSPSHDPSKMPAEELFCNPVLPGVDECGGIKVDENGNVHRKISLFHTGWGMNGVPVGGSMARR